MTRATVPDTDPVIKRGFEIACDYEVMMRAFELLRKKGWSESVKGSVILWRHPELSEGRSMAFPKAIALQWMAENQR